MNTNQRYKAIQFGTVTWIVIDTERKNRFVGKATSKRIAEKFARELNADG